MKPKTIGVYKEGWKMPRAEIKIFIGDDDVTEKIDFLNDELFMQFLNGIRHNHEASDENIDTCKKCGRDFRNTLFHLTVNPDALKI